MSIRSLSKHHKKLDKHSTVCWCNYKLCLKMNTIKKTLRRYLVSVVSADVAQRGRRWLAEGGVDHVGGLKPRCITSQDREHRGRPGRSGRGWREVGQPLRQSIHVHLDFRIIKVLFAIAVVWISISSETTSMNIIKIEFLYFLKRNEIFTLQKKKKQRLWHQLLQTLQPPGGSSANIITEPWICMGRSGSNKRL